MVFGIKYTSNTKKNRLKMAFSLQNYGGAFMLKDGKLEYYFDNVFAAIKTSSKLNNSHDGNIRYSVFSVDKQSAKSIPADHILGSYDEYDDIMAKKYDDLFKQLEEKQPTM